MKTDNTMFKNYLKVAWRNLIRQKIYSFINIAGLAIGLTACIMISLYVLDEFSYDRHHTHADRIYRLTRDFKAEDGEVSLHLGHVASPFGPLLREDFPDMEAVARTFQTKLLVSDEPKQKSFTEPNAFVVEPEIFDIFSIKMVKGDGRKALAEPFTMLLSDRAANKYFPGEDPVGKVLKVQNKYLIKVAGIFETFPRTSHLHPEILQSFSTLEDPSVYGKENLQTAWGNDAFGTYVLLPQKYPAEKLQAQFPAFLDRHLSATGRFGNQKPSAATSLYLQKVTDIHLKSNLDSETEPNGDLKSVLIMAAVAGFILLIACINYINLCTARSTSRAKEIGIRKVAGAHQQTLIGQFLVESVVVAVLATLLAMGLTEVLLPWLNALTGKEMTLSFLANPLHLTILLVLPLAVGLLAGLYPALYLSKFQPMVVLKGSLSSTAKNPLLRKTLVVTQFAISISLVIATAVISKQLDFMQSTSLGFDKEHVVILNYNRTLAEQYEAFKQDLLRSSNIKKVGKSLSVPSERLLNSLEAKVQKGDSMAATGITMKFVAVDEDVFDTYSIKMAAGRNFLKGSVSDSSGYILNESAVKKVGWANPQEAVGKPFQYGNRRGQVIGVVKDLHFESLHQEISPMVFVIPDIDSYENKIGVRITGNTQAALAHIENTWKKFAPQRPFEYRFLDEMYGELYQAEQLKKQLFTIFSGIAIFIACLGLFGLASYTAEQRTREIGIRKVLGSSVQDIMLLLSKDFALLVVIAIVLATPVAWYGMSKWLEDFAYRVSIDWSIVVFTGLLAMVIALLTVSFHAAKAAMMNPVKALRSE